VSKWAKYVFAAPALFTWLISVHLTYRKTELRQRVHTEDPSGGLSGQRGFSLVAVINALPRIAADVTPAE
jgi:hypothetical protein